MARVSSECSSTEIVEYSTILIIEFGFDKITLTEEGNKNIKGAKRNSSGNPILLIKEIKSKRKKGSSVGEPLAKFWLFPSVSETEEIKKIPVGESLANYGCYL